MDAEQEMICAWADFLVSGLVISPWLAGIGPTARFNADLYNYIDAQARDMADTLWNSAEQKRSLLLKEMPLRIPRTAIYEIVSSTAVSLAHSETGSTEVSADMVERALLQTRRFCSEHSFATLVNLYGVATGYENMQAIDFYDGMPERDFILGHWHRPWVDYSLSDELATMVMNGYFRVDSQGAQRVVRLTDNGQELFRNRCALLEQNGYLSQRVRQLHISRFNLYTRFEESTNVICPSWVLQRRDFLDWSQITPGMRVLELGCGDGIFTFSGGLAQRVGKTGQVVAVDPSRGMLARAMERDEAKSSPWVEFMQGYAEQLPFATGEFDAVVGVSFLHFTDLPKALAEMRRVTRPGGLVASFTPVSYRPQAPFFKDWFAPLFDLAKRFQQSEIRDYLSTATQMEEAWNDAGFGAVQTVAIETANYYFDAKLVVDLLLRGVGWFQEELAMIPWQAREDLIAELTTRGERVCREYVASERVIHFPQQMIRGFA